MVQYCKTIIQNKRKSRTKVIKSKTTYPTLPSPPARSLIGSAGRGANIQLEATSIITPITHRIVECLQSADVHII